MSLTAYDVFLLMQKKIDGWFNHKSWYSYCYDCGSAHSAEAVPWAAP